MPTSNKTSSCKMENNKSQEELSTHEDSSSEQEQGQDQEVTFHPFHVPHMIPSMFMPCIEDAKMDWTVNDGLYHRFLKCHLKCKSILECELAMLVERRKCKKGYSLEWDFWD